MTTTRARIQNLVERGTVQPEEADALLAAVGARARPRAVTVLLDPLECFGSVQLTLVGSAAALAGVAIERWGIAFDGFIDLHVAAAAPWSLQQSAARAVVAWPMGALVLWVVSLVAGRQGRYVDFLGVVGVSRLPLVFFAVPIAMMTGSVQAVPGAPASLGTGLALVLAIVGLAVLAVGWALVLSYRGFATASGLRGGKRIVGYVAGVLLAEIASKLILTSLH